VSNSKAPYLMITHSLHDVFDSGASLFVGEAALFFLYPFDGDLREVRGLLSLSVYCEEPLINFFSYWSPLTFDNRVFSISLPGGRYSTMLSFFLSLTTAENCVRISCNA
jgi:hypothetical protein